MCKQESASSDPSTHIKTDRHAPVISTLERKSRSVPLAQKLGRKVIEEDI